MTAKKRASKPATKKTAKPKKVAPPARRTIPCRLCRMPIEFTSGLDEMADHWSEEHPDAYAKLRASLGHEEEA